MWSVYIVSSNLGQLYTGISTDVNRRVQQHGTAKGAKALRGKAPITLLWSETVGDRSAASKVEALIKKQSRVKKLALIRGEQVLSHWLISAGERDD